MEGDNSFETGRGTRTWGGAMSTASLQLLQCPGIACLTSKSQLKGLESITKNSGFAVMSWQVRHGCSSLRHVADNLAQIHLRGSYRIMRLEPI